MKLRCQYLRCIIWSIFSKEKFQLIFLFSSRRTVISSLSLLFSYQRKQKANNFLELCVPVESNHSCLAPVLPVDNSSATSGMGRNVNSLPNKPFPSVVSKFWRSDAANRLCVPLHPFSMDISLRRMVFLSLRQRAENSTFATFKN